MLFYEKVKKHKQTRQPYYIAMNLFNRDFATTDLSSIQDLYNGEINAYSIGEHHDTIFVLLTLTQLNHLPEGCT